jgi:hypothetical protein
MAVIIDYQIYTGSSWIKKDGSGTNLLGLTANSEIAEVHLSLRSCRRALKTLY